MCLLSPLMAAGGQHRAQIHTSTRQNGMVCTKRASTPHQKHASAREDTVNTLGGGGGWYYRIRVLALCSCADKWRLSPGRPVYGLMIVQSIHFAEALHPYCVRRGVCM